MCTIYFKFIQKCWRLNEPTHFGIYFKNWRWLKKCEEIFYEGYGGVTFKNVNCGCGGRMNIFSISRTNNIEPHQTKSSRQIQIGNTAKLGQSDFVIYSTEMPCQNCLMRKLWRTDEFIFRQFALFYNTKTQIFGGGTNVWWR